MPANAGNLIEESHRLDRDRTLAILFAEPGDRELLAALVLLNAELARIPEITAEPMAGMIRYQWWRDAAQGAARGEGVGRHPLLPSLAQALAQGLIELDPILALIDAREAELDRLQPAALGELEAYAEATSGRLHRLLVGTLAADRGTAAAAGDVGVGLALVGIVRAIGFHRHQGRVLLPKDLMDRESVDPGDILAAANAEALARVTGQILDRARARLDAATAAGPFKRRAMAALLPARLARRQARHLRAQGPGGLGGPGRDLWTVPDLAWHWLRCRL